MYIDGDPTRLAQVFANLLNNAAKYTPRGGSIRLSGERTGDEVVISVKDNGIGFAPEWTKDLPNRNFELRPVRGVDLKIGLGVAWSKEDPTASRDDIIDIARSLARPSGR